MGVLLAETGHKVALAEAVAAARQQELQQEQIQTDLFGPDPGSAASAAPAPVADGRRGPGRPFGARNKRTDEASRFYMGQFGDPLSRAVQVSALPVLAEGVLDAFAKLIGASSRIEAFREWRQTLAATLPFCHQRLATLTVRPEGAPDGEAVSWLFSDDGMIEACSTPGIERHELNELEEAEP